RRLGPRIRRAITRMMIRWLGWRMLVNKMLSFVAPKSTVACGSGGLPAWGSRGGLPGFVALAVAAGLTRSGVCRTGEVHDGSEELRGLAFEQAVSGEALDGGDGAAVVVEGRPDD